MNDETTQRIIRKLLTKYDFDCDEPYTSNDAAKEEEDSDSDSDDFHCPRCDAMFRDVNDLIEHLKLHQSEPQEPPDEDVPQTSRSSEVDPYSNTFIKELAVETTTLPPQRSENPPIEVEIEQPPAPVKYYKCTLCPYTVAIKSYVVRHLRMRHSNLTKYKCPHCPFASNNDDSYMKHLVMHENGEKQFWRCSHCLFSTNSRIEAARHSRHVECNLCSYTGDCEYYHSKHKKTHNYS